MRSNKIYYLIVLYAITSTVAWSNSMPGAPVDKIVAQVDDYVILQSELETACQHYLHQGAEETPDMRENVLKYLIQEKIRLAQAKREGHATIKDQEIEAQLNQRIKQLVEQAGSEKALIEHFGDSMQSLKRTIRQQIKNNLIVNNVRRSIFSQVSVTPQEVKSFFESLSVEKHSFEPAEVIIRQIVKYPLVKTQVKNILCEQLLALRKRIQEGESFEMLAGVHSEDPGSVSQGGEVGFKKQGELAPEYEAAALALQPGEISEPVATQFGFHLIQLIAREGSQYNTRHILLRPSLDDLDIETTRAELDQLRTDLLAGKIDFKKAVQDFSEDIITKSTGGLVEGPHGHLQQVVDELPEDIFFAIDTLEQGDISEPILFASAGSRQAIRILWLEKKIEPHPTSLAQDYEKIRQQLVEQKTMQAYQDWLKKAESETFIKLAPEYQSVMQ